MTMLVLPTPPLPLLMLRDLNRETGVCRGDALF